MAKKISELCAVATPSNCDQFETNQCGVSKMETRGQIRDNIAVSELANGTDGNLITWDSAGAPAVVATGTATHVLTSNGAGAAPTFQAAAGGGGFCTVVKACDQGIVCDTTLTSDCCLKFCIDANKKYAYFGNISVNSNSVADFKWTLVGPACSTGRFIDGFFGAVSSASYDMEPFTTVITGSTCAGADARVNVSGYVNNAGTAGTVAFQWAQATANGCTCTILRAGSWIAYKKLD